MIFWKMSVTLYWKMFAVVITKSDTPFVYSGMDLAMQMLFL